MNNPLGLSIPRSVGSGSGLELGSESSMSPTISSLPVWLCSGSFANLIIAAEKLAVEHNSPKICHYLANELKSLPEYIRKMVEKFPETFNDNAKLRVMHKEDEKTLCERVKSEFLITMNLCDQLTETFQHLASQIRDAEKDEDYVVNGLFDSFTALSIVNDRLKDIFRLVSSEMTFQDKLKTSSVIVVKTHDKFLRHLDLARMSDGLMVMLFLLRSHESYSKALLQFVELSDQYHYDHGEDSVNFLAVRRQVSARVFKVKHYPTAVVMKGDKEVGKVTIAESGFLSAVFAGLKLILDDCLKEDDIECKFDGVKMWNEERDWLEKGVDSDNDSDGD